MRRVAVLASGGGSNLQAILDHLSALGDGASATVAVVISDRAGAHALERARLRGIAALHVPRSAPDGALARALEEHEVEFVALAGYLQLIPSAVVRRWRGKMLNVHPALLPAFGGQGMFGHHVHEAVLAAGAKLSGATVHFVDEQFDRGAILAQWPVPVRTDDTPDTLAARVLKVEHKIYPWCVDALARGDVRLGDDGQVHGALPYDFPRFGVEGEAHPFVPDV